MYTHGHLATHEAAQQPDHLRADWYAANVVAYNGYEHPDAAVRWACVYAGV